MGRVALVGLVPSMADVVAAATAFWQGTGGNATKAL